MDQKAQLYKSYIEYLKRRDNSRYLDSQRKYHECKFCSHVTRRPTFEYTKPLDKTTGLPKIHHYRMCKACHHFWTRHRFRLTVEIRKRLKLQGDQHCNICGLHKSQFEKGLEIDHCHKTDHVRGHLCIYCNVGLGNNGYNDNIDRILSDIDHLMNGYFHRLSPGAAYFRNSVNVLREAVAYLRIHNLLSDV